MIVFIASVGLAAILGIWLISDAGRGSLRGFEDALLSTFGFLALFSILAFANCEAWDRRICHPLGPIGFGVTIAAFLLIVTPAWGRALAFPFPPRSWWNSREFWTLSILMVILAVCLADIGLLFSAQLPRKHLWMRKVTVYSTLIFAALVALVIVDNGYLNASFLGRGVAILGIFVGFGTLGIHFLHRFSKLRKPVPYEMSRLTFTMTCPRCSTSQLLAVGRSACAQCGLKFLIEIEENLCEKCGYSLYRLESATCPECGTPILQNPHATGPAT